MTLAGLCLCQAPGFGNLGVKKGTDTGGQHEGKAQEWGSQGRHRVQMEGAETPTRSSDKQFLGRR